MNATPPEAATLLMVEDDPHVRLFLRAALANRGYHVAEAETGQLALSMILARMPDLILLDLGLPDMDGMTVLRRVREWSQVPVIVLTARGQEDCKVEAFAAGADDYLTKPCGVPETLARIAVALRHAGALKNGGQEEATRFQTAELVVDLAHRSVTVKGKPVHFSPIEYDLLATFARNAGKLLTHQYLLREIWGLGCLAQVHYLHIYVANLRKKIEEDPADPRYLLTEPGVGYRLVPIEPWEPSSGREVSARPPGAGHWGRSGANAAGRPSKKAGHEEAGPPPQDDNGRSARTDREVPHRS